MHLLYNETKKHLFIKTNKHSATSLIVWLKARILFEPTWPCQSKGVVLWSANTAIKRRGWGAVLWSAVKRSLDVFTERTLLGLWNTVPFSLSFNLRFLHPPFLPLPLSSLMVYCVLSGVAWNPSTLFISAQPVTPQTESQKQMSSLVSQTEKTTFSCEVKENC